MHFESAVKYVLLGVVIYAVDNFMRIVKTRVTKARVRALPELGITEVELPTVTTGWRAGQHVRIRFLTTELGITSWSIAHPFTIANASDSAGGKGLTLLCKKAGRWTNSLYAAAERADHYGMEGGYGHYRKMNVMVEGPYGTCSLPMSLGKGWPDAFSSLGGLGNMVLSSYSGVLIITGGSGVTLALSAAEEVVQMVQKGKSNVRFIELVWITQDMSTFSLPAIWTCLLNQNFPRLRDSAILLILLHCIRLQLDPGHSDQGHGSIHTRVRNSAGEACLHS